MFNLELTYPQAETVVSALRDKRSEIDRNIKYAYESWTSGRRGATWSEREVAKYHQDRDVIEGILVTFFGFAETEPPERPAEPEETEENVD
jgi:hypothetical protein